MELKKSERNNPNLEIIFPKKNDIVIAAITSNPDAIPILKGLKPCFESMEGKVTMSMPTAVAKRKMLKKRRIVSWEKRLMKEDLM